MKKVVIGLPEEEDLSQYQALALQFVEKSGWHKVLGADMDCLSIIDWAIQKQIEDPETMFAIAAKKEQEVVGFMVMIRYSPPMAPNKVLAQELAWYVHPDHRRLLGMRMYKIAKDWAISMGVDALIMTSLVSGEKDLGPMYEKMGYINIETLYALPLRS